MPQIVWTADHNGVVNYYNDKWFEFIGRPDNQVHWLQLVHPTDRAHVAENWQTGTVSKRPPAPFHGELRLLDPKTDQYKWFLVRATYIDPAVDHVHWIGTCTDIDDQRRLSEQAYESERRLQFIQSSLPIIIYATDTEGIVQFSVGKILDELPKDRLPIAGVNVLNLLDNTAHITFKSVVVDGNTETFSIVRNDRYFQITWAPMRGVTSQEITGVLGLAIDVTETEKISQEREALIMRETIAIEASKIKTQFLANMSHELRTPLNGILGMAEILLETSLNQEQHYCAESIKQNVEYLAVLVNDILDISRIESGHLDLKESTFSLHNTMSEIENSFRFTATQKQIDFIVNYDNNIPYKLYSDSYRIMQIMTNLLSNAIKFTEQGEVNVTVKLMDLKDNSALIQFSVVDTGIGMTDELKQRLFTPFMQGDLSSTRKYRGTGLGLYITKMLVDLLGGEINIESTVGVGTKVVVLLRFKLASPEPHESSGKESTSVVDLHGKTVLVAEDNEVNLLIARRTLEKAGIHVYSAKNGQEAVDIFKSNGHNIDLILMDIQMPIMDGFQATSLIRKIDESIPIVAMTASAMKEDVARTFAMGLNDHISKPFRAEELLQVVARNIRSR